MVLSRGGQGVVILRGIVVTSTVSDQVGQCARVRDTRHHTVCYAGKITGTCRREVLRTRRDSCISIFRSTIVAQR